MSYTRWLVIAVIVWQATATHAANDDFEQWKRSQNQGLSQIKQDFRDYKDENDRQFADFLKAQWREFDTAKGIVRDSQPKPIDAPQVKITPLNSLKPTIKPTLSPRATPRISPTASPSSTPTFVPSASPTALPMQAVKPAKNQQVFEFYGNRMAAPYPAAWRGRLTQGAFSAEVLSAAWSTLATSDYQPTLDYLAQRKASMHLDDWSYFSLLRAYASALQPQSPTQQNLLIWFLMIKSGYDVRSAYLGNDLYIFVAAEQQVYGTKYITVQNRSYYALLAADRGDSMQSYYTYDAPYPAVLKPLDLRMRSLAFTQPIVVQRALRWDYQGKHYAINAEYDRRVIDYLASYPQADIRVPFSSGLSAISHDAMVRELRPLMLGMNEEQAVNFLLAFVQKAFPYKTDEAQFGYEKYFFADEVLFYPYSDCEDRSVLFASLIRDLTGFDVIGLDYPGHIATAVHFNQSRLGGDAVRGANGENYWIADPTYIGATTGMSQPAYRKVKPTLIVW